MKRRLAAALMSAGAMALALVFAGAALAQARSAETPVCAKCHEESHTSIALTAHGARNDASGRLCQACHGDATEHLKDPTKVGMPNRFAKKLPGDDKSRICLACHDGHRQLAFWDSGKHRKNDVACNDCHNIHGKPGNPSVSPFVTTQRRLQYETCNTCHKNIRAQINKTSHHPIVEGKVACSDCHNPHGALSHAMVKNESVNQLCIDCHGDKRGPFVWEHAPVEENCLSCHNAHGSNHAKLLNEKVPNLCQDCHDWSRHPGTFYGGNASFAPGTQNTRFLARSCVNCHQAIHGSNAPGNRGKFFTR
jgi:DmsE family decaheme c-type cytochrome